MHLYADGDDTICMRECMSHAVATAENRGHHWLSARIYLQVLFCGNDGDDDGDDGDDDDERHRLRIDYRQHTCAL